MEIGVQSGGKIPLLRKYFGPGFQYIGIDINPSTLQFQTQPDDDFNAHIEIGDSANATFLEYIANKYPHVDIFLDDGGHTMEQQITAIRHFLPHVQPEGIYMCEDLGTSWQKIYGGIPNGKSYSPDDLRFMNETMVGFIHQTMDWFTAATMRGKHSYYAQEIDTIFNCKFDCSDSPTNPWWKTIPKQVKHIHYYNQLVVFEKGVTQMPTPLQTVGTEIPIGYSGEYDPINWKRILQKIDDEFEAASVEFG
jgi:phosphoribosyl 1,2-cyclic phosphodiesterase